METPGFGAASPVNEPQPIIARSSAAHRSGAQSSGVAGAQGSHTAGSQYNTHGETLYGHGTHNGTAPPSFSPEAGAFSP